MAFIEQARRNISEKEAAGNACKDVFDASIALLREKGKLTRDFIWKYQSIDHRVNSAEPSIQVFLSTGANIDKARK